MSADMTPESAARIVVAYEPSLGRLARTGTRAELARGTFRSAIEHARAGRREEAAELVEVSLLEAQELREVYAVWPEETAQWLLAHGIEPRIVDAEIARLTALVGDEAMAGIEHGWAGYEAAAGEAATLCRAVASATVAEATAAIDRARARWQTAHDQAVDRVAGVVDIAVRLRGEASLRELWNFLMRDWYDVHARRYDLGHQPWKTSAHQLMTAIVDGFHAHLTGTARQGDIELIEEPDRIGFRFAPCGSGGRSIDPTITGGTPRSGPPFGFAVTTQEHDWAWNTVGICSYCVHCCLLNEVMPIDRLGFPTRVIDPPVWPASRTDPACTWWVYRHPSLIPDAVYERVGRSPHRRPGPEAP